MQNDIARVDVNGKTTFSKTMKRHSSITITYRFWISFRWNTKCYPTIYTAKMILIFEVHRIPPDGFLMQDGNHDRLPEGKSNFSSTEYGDWLCELFECYTSDPTPVPIQFFDDIIKVASQVTQALKKAKELIRMEF